MEQLGQIGYLLMPDLNTSMNLLLIVTFVLLLATIMLFLIFYRNQNSPCPARETGRKV